MIVYILTDMEGVAGIDHWDQCYDPDDASPKYIYGKDQLTLDLNAAVEGAFDGGATKVRVLDGHGRNHNKGLVPGLLDPRAEKMWIASNPPIRWEGLDEHVACSAMIGQHAMAGTINGFIDHTQSPKQITRLMINGVEHGEMSQWALCCAGFNVPMVFTSGDEALCDETRRLFPQARTVPTKKGTGWATCELYDTQKVRENIRREMAAAVRNRANVKPWTQKLPIEIRMEFAWSEYADGLAKIPGVTRLSAREVRWFINDPRDIYDYPSAAWKPMQP